MLAGGKAGPVLALRECWVLLYGDIHMLGKVRRDTAEAGAQTASSLGAFRWDKKEAVYRSVGSTQQMEL